MTRFRLGALVGAAALGTALSAAGAAAPALAAAHAPHVCPAGEWYSVSGSKPYFILRKGDKTTGPHGVRLRLGVSSGTKVSGQVTASGSYNLNDLISKADAKISAKIAFSRTSSVSQSAEWKVPKSDPVGWLGWGSWGYKFNWQRGHYIGSCRFVVDRRGTAKLPAKATGFDKGKGEGPPAS
jgi:hypothetical protein